MVDFSFIIPLYNKDSVLLRRCIASIPLDNSVQVIIVDDHSPSFYDEDGVIIKRIIHELPYYDCKNVEYYFSSKNRGPGHARNFAINKALGKWIFFCDADDYYDSKLLIDFMNDIMHSDADVIQFGYNKVDDNCVEKISYDVNLLNDNPIIELDNNNKDQFLKVMYPWMRAVNRRFINRHNIRFANLYLSEDRVFCVKSVLLSSKYMLYNKPIYNYVQYNSSLSHVVPTFSKAYGAVNEAIKVNRLLREHDKIDEYRDFSLSKYLCFIYEYSTICYWWMLIKDAIEIGVCYALDDRRSVCYMRNVHSNLLRQWRTKLKF